MEYLYNIKLRCKRPVNPAYPKELKTVGDYLRKERLDRGLSQSQVAKIIGVTTDAITNWELNRNQPRLYLFPSVINFLGYNPLEKEDMTFGQKIKSYRYIHGLQIKQLAKQIGIDSETLIRIENNRKYFVKSYIKVADYFDKIK